MVTCKPGQPAIEILDEDFFIEFKGESYSCRGIKANGRVLYQINFRSSYLYITKTINQHGIPFWTAIPQDLKLRRIVAELGRQLEDHLIKMLCATTTALR
jgi:hypothetical protein